MSAFKLERQGTLVLCVCVSPTAHYEVVLSHLRLCRWRLHPTNQTQTETVLGEFGRRSGLVRAKHPRTN